MDHDMIACEECNCVDLISLAGVGPNGQHFCSMHNPNSRSNGKWHGQFPREQYDPKVHIVINKPLTSNLSLSFS